MYNLILTLGHNSSAILVDNDGYILIGYENERITEIKSDSHFPILAIAEIGKYYDLNLVTRVYVSQWNTFGKIEESSSKHWGEESLRLLCPNIKSIETIDHHDAHVYALRSFAGKVMDWEIVADGFGNFNETMSVYHKGELVMRAFGFEKSLGLLYQYTTAYLGMKMNQDEYKLLGYEAHIREVCDMNLISKILEYADKRAQFFFESIIIGTLRPNFDAVAGLEALPNIRQFVDQNIKYMLSQRLKLSRLTDYEKRVIVAFYTQHIVERTMYRIVQHFGMNEVGLSGGLFMNVKLNNAIAKLVSRICVYPLCGDQGAGLGVYEYFNHNLKWAESLCIGRRDLSNFPLNEPKTILYNSLSGALEQLKSQLRANKIVNFVYGDMEFGARALGHTTTFAMPTKENVEYINMLNDRSTIMPMAAMVDSDTINAYYIGAHKVIKSLGYMIITLTANFDMNKETIGCHHKDPISNEWTNRVQSIDKSSPFYPVLLEFGMVINTSFNMHGVPILYNTKQILSTHRFQMERDKDNRMLTIIVK